MAEEKLDLVSREQALRVARMLGCQGAHEAEKGWMPCGSHEEYEAIKKGKEEYLKVLASKKKKPLPKMVQRTKRLETKSDAYYENRADAVAISKARGCGGVRTVLLAGKKYYAVCNHKAPKRGWENLDEKPITGIATLPGGGLVSGSFSGKSLEEKGFVNFVSRSTDPDTFSDPESARIRARNLGCIGIRRYTARDGKLVWLPCTNVSDYNRVTGIRGDNSPRNNPRRQGSKFGKKVLGTPIGGGSNEDGDGDGFTTGGIIGGEDKIPVIAKIDLLDTNYKFDIPEAKTEAGKELQKIVNGKSFDRETLIGALGKLKISIYPYSSAVIEPQKLGYNNFDEMDFSSQRFKDAVYAYQKERNFAFHIALEKSLSGATLPVAKNYEIKYLPESPTILNPTKPHTYFGDLLTIKDNNNEHKIKIKDLSPPNHSIVKPSGLARWERGASSKREGSAAENFHKELGWFASQIANIVAPFEKPDSKWRGVSRGGAPKADDSVLKENARNLLKGIEMSKPQPTLWRGVGASRQAENDSVIKQLSELKIGDTFDAPLFSTTRDPVVAQVYGSIIFRIREGAKGVKMPAGQSKFPQDQEVISGGKFKVKLIEKVFTRDNSRLEIIKRQLMDARDLPKDHPIYGSLVHKELIQRYEKKLIRESERKPQEVTVIDLIQEGVFSSGA